MSTYIEKIHEDHDQIVAVAQSLCSENTQVTHHIRKYEYDTSVNLLMDGVPLIFDRCAAYHKGLRIRVRPDLPIRVDGAVQDGATVPSITFSPSKAPEAIRRDLIRRMLPDARECISRAKRNNDEASAQAYKVRDTFEALRRHCPGIRLIVGTDDKVRAHFDGNARIEHVGADRVTIHTHDLPTALAIKILTLIKEAA